jgi:hypothetical protein
MVEKLIFCAGKTRLAFLDLLLEAQEKKEEGQAAPKLTDTDIREETDTFMFEVSGRKWRKL